MKSLQIASRLANVDPALAEILREVEEAVNRHLAYDTEGFGSPEGVVVGRKGLRYRRIDGSTGTCLYIFEGTNGANTGWAAK